MLIDHIEKRFRTGEDAGPTALIVLDLTGYRDILRALGHDVAEDLLAHTARRLWKAAEDGEYVAHIGTDDFGVYLPIANDPAHVSSRALAFLSAITQPIELGTSDPGTTHVTLGATAGAAYSITPIGSGAELLRQASVALSQARAENITFEFYNPAMDELGGPAAVVLNSELHAAIRDDQLDLHYQPIIDLPSGAPLAMEAMLRWSHPTKGLLRSESSRRCWSGLRTIHGSSPGSSNGRSTPGEDGEIGTFRSASISPPDACSTTGSPNRSSPPSIALVCRPISSCSRSTRRRCSAISGWSATCSRSCDCAACRSRSTTLGSGTSSLFSLLRVPATHVKVDGHYVRTCSSTPRRWPMVCLGLDLSRRADLQFVATGVNSVELITALRQCGCDAAQGPYFIRPLVADDGCAYLANAPEIPDVPDASVVALDTRRHTPVP